MNDPILPQRLQSILPGEWTAVRDGYSITTPAGPLAVTTPYSQYLVRIGIGVALKTYDAADLPTLIRRVLGDEVFTAIASGTDAAKADRDRRRSELNKSRQDAEASLHQAEANLAAIEAQIAEFERETAP